MILYNKTLSLLISILILASCASNKRLKRFQKDENGLPKWINSPMASCKESVDLCVVGEGSGGMSAEADGHKNMAQFFENTITAKTVTTMDSSSEKDGDLIVSGEMTESVNEKIEEVTKELMLKGVELRERYEADDRVYVLMALDKRKAASSFASEIKIFDEKLKADFETQKRSSVRKLVQNFEARERLNSHYEVLTGKRIPKRYSYDQILALKRNKLGKNFIIYVNVTDKNGQKVEGLQTLVVQSLLASDFKVTTKEQNKAQIKVKGEITSLKQFLNVDGFVKYKFIFKLTSKNQKNQHVGAMKIESTQIARSYKQAYDRALEKMNKLLISEDRISDLELIE